MDGIDELASGLWQTGAIKFGNFTLKSGIQSPFYINLRLPVSDPSLLRRAAHAMSNMARGLEFNRIAGIPYAGLPLAVLISEELDVPLVYPRKEVKTYGDIRAIEGDYSPGETIVVVDDVITDGQSKIEAIAPLEDAGLVVNDLVILVDRQQGGSERMAKKGYQLRSVTTITDLLDTLRTQQIISQAEYQQSINHIQEVRF